MKNLLVFILLIGLLSCEETRLKPKYVQITDIVETDTVSSSPCALDDFAEITGELNYVGNFSLKRERTSEYEDLIIEWRRDEQMRFRYYDPDGFKGAMERGRVVYLRLAWNLQVDVFEKYFGDLRSYRADGYVYLIPHPDGTLEIDWCDLDVRVRGYYEDKCRGGIRFTP